ncbi:sialidase family protein [Paenibacillus thalictri]|nr:sialidase family protein [Paenibacillus thalictri]
MSLPASEGVKDGRNIKWGAEIPREHYCDQPYVVVAEGGHWVCVLTTGRGVEGEQGQHVVSAISYDQGRTWSELTDIEPADGPEASWVMPLLVPGGRIYAFYTYNKDNLREMKADFEHIQKRVDTLGFLMFKYSDDGGISWSEQRYHVPIREMQIDRDNPYGGAVQYFWGVGKPIVHEGAVYMGLAKVGRFGDGFMATSEGIFLKSANILTESDPARIKWETLPEGESGIRAPLGKVADEHNLVGLSDGSLYCTYRTVEGHNGQAYSRDGGHTWTAPEYAEYQRFGRKIKHPRAANFVRKFSNGKFILWFHNHGKDNRATPSLAYRDRNPAWLCGGIERNGYIEWSQPEIVLFDDDPAVRISYPDFIEDGGRYFITETQKTVARVHEIDPQLLEAMWNQHENNSAAARGLALELAGPNLAGAFAEMPPLPALREGGGFAVDAWIYPAAGDAGSMLLDTRGKDGKGVAISMTERWTLRITLNDGRSEAAWESDAGIISPNAWLHAAIIVDGGPNMITFVINGQLCDGGAERQFGWGRFSPYMLDVNGGEKALVGPDWKGIIGKLRVYDRYLLTSEAVGNYRAGL